MDVNLRNELLSVFPVNDLVCEINNKESILKNILSSTRAYRDMMPRHLKGIGRPEVKQKKEAVLTELAEKLSNQILNPATSQTEYDEWHKETCIWLTNNIQSLCNPGIVVKPGKAQKLINMSMKYIFCCPSAEMIALNDAFQYCHMPLDRYVLSWYYREVCGQDYVSFESKDKMDWGRMEYKTYFNIQNNIRTFLKDSTRNHDYYFEDYALTAFETEFYIWNEERVIRLAKEFSDQLTTNERSIHWMKCSAMRNNFKRVFDVLTEVHDRFNEG